MGGAEILDMGTDQGKYRAARYENGELECNLNFDCYTEDQIQRKPYRKTRVMTDWRLGGEGEPNNYSVHKLVGGEVMNLLCTKNNQILGAAKSGSIWNMITALSPDTIRRVGNECKLKSLAGEYTLLVGKVRDISCANSGDGYNCSFNYSLTVRGPGEPSYFAKLLEASRQPATATFTRNNAGGKSGWKMSNFRNLGG